MTEKEAIAVRRELMKNGPTPEIMQYLHEQWIKDREKLKNIFSVKQEDNERV